MTTPDPRLVAFGRRLRELRLRANFTTGTDFANTLGWQQPKVSKIETGKQFPTDSDVEAWFKATKTPESVASALLDELREIRIEAASWRHQLTKGHKDRQVTAARTEQQSERIRAFEMALVPGLGQLADYARAALESHARLHGVSPDIESAVAVRMERQRLLYDTTKSIELLIMEPALRYAICPPERMVAQIDRLFTLTSLAGVRFGIIPLETTLPVIPMHGFWVFDDSVIIETNDSEITTDTPEDVALYNRVIDQLWTVAVTDDQARKILTECATRWATIAKGGQDG